MIIIIIRSVVKQWRLSTRCVAWQLGMVIARLERGMFIVLKTQHKRRGFESCLLIIKEQLKTKTMGNQALSSPVSGSCYTQSWGRDAVVGLIGTICCRSNPWVGLFRVLPSWVELFHIYQVELNYFVYVFFRSYQDQLCIIDRIRKCHPAKLEQKNRKKTEVSFACFSNRSSRQLLCINDCFRSVGVVVIVTRSQNWISPSQIWHVAAGRDIKSKQLLSFYHG